MQTTRVDVITTLANRTATDDFFGEVWGEPQPGYCSVPLNGTGNPCGVAYDPSTCDNPADPNHATHYASSGVYTREAADTVLAKIASENPLFSGFEDDGSNGFPGTALDAWLAANMSLYRMVWPDE